MNAPVCQRPRSLSDQPEAPKDFHSKRTSMKWQNGYRYTSKYISNHTSIDNRKYSASVFGRTQEIQKISQEFKLVQLSTDNQLCNRSTTQQYIHYWFTIHLPLYICISYNRAQSCNDMSDVRTWSHVSTTLRIYRELEISDRKTCCFAMHCCSIMHCTCDCLDCRNATRFYYYKETSAMYI